MAVDGVRRQGETTEQEVVQNEVHYDNTTKRTPLPKFQLFVVYLIQFAEPITATVIYPFVNQFVRSTGVTGGDERKTGYFAGVIVRPLSNLNYR
jgi:hypothetical protein